MSHKLNKSITDGPIFGNMILFCIPLMLTAILQVLYSAADMMILGIFENADAVGSVGATNSLNHLIVNFFMGLSVGSTIVVAQYIGAGKQKDVKETVSTSITVAFIIGAIVTVFGILIAKPALTAMKTPETLIGNSTVYLRTVFAGMIPTLVYNYGASILRASGDAQRPLIILTCSGIANVILNCLFVAIFKMGVFGVGLATIISQTGSAIAVLCILSTTKDSIRLSIKCLRVYKDKFFRILSAGFPSSIQSCMFSASNVLIQSTINSFGDFAVNGSSAASNLDGLVTTALSAVSHTAITFVSQNVGAKKFKRLGKIAFYCILISIVVGLSFGGLIILFDNELLAIFVKDSPESIAVGEIRLGILCTSAALCGMMDSMSGVLRGMNASLHAMIISILGICVFRVVWINTACVMFPAIETVYISYPVTWILTFTAEFICFLIIKRNLIKKTNEFELQNC